MDGDSHATSKAEGEGSTPLVYPTAYAFRAALKDRLAAVSRASGGYGVAELQRQFAYDRLLARCFTDHDSKRWVLKGAGALLARLQIARHSKDIDLYFSDDAAGVDEAAGALATAAERDLGDHFRFEVVRTSPLQESAKGRRIHLAAYLGARYADFHVDVVVGTVMTGAPDLVDPLVPMKIVGLARPQYRAFPLADHIADKVCAVLETHHQADTPHFSSRVKDLVDIALIAGSQPVSGRALRKALLAGAAHRELDLPERFAVPDIAAWRSGYPKKAAEAPGATLSFAGALELAAGLLDPVLTEAIDGTWSPTDAVWIPELNRG